MRAYKKQYKKARASAVSKFYFHKEKARKQQELASKKITRSPVRQSTTESKQKLEQASQIEKSSYENERKTKKALPQNKNAMPRRQTNTQIATAAIFARAVKTTTCRKCNQLS